MEAEELKDTLRFIEERIVWLEEDMAKGKKHDDDVVKVIDKLTAQIAEPRGSDSGTSIPVNLHREFLKGVIAWRNQVQMW